MYDAQWNIQLSTDKTSACLIHLAAKQWRIEEHTLICRLDCGADCFATTSARNHDEHRASSPNSLCILQAGNSRMHRLSQSRRRLSCTFGSSQSYLGRLALQSLQSDNRTLVLGVKKGTCYLALSHANVKSDLFFHTCRKDLLNFT